MRKIQSLYNIIFRLIVPFIIFSLNVSCNKSLLTEKPKDFLTTGNAFKDPKTFQMFINSLYNDARTFIFKGTDGQSGGYPYREYLRMGTDVATCGQAHRPYLFVDFSKITPTTDLAADFWDAAYSTLIPHANTVIDRAQLPDVNWKDDMQRNQVIAEARFFRAYAYYTLVNIYGAVPLIKHEVTNPKFDFARAPKDTILNFVRTDLEFASQWLPSDPDKVEDGKLTSAAANMLLATDYLQLEMPDSAVSATSRIIDSRHYHLMTQRFGGDPTHHGHFPSDGGDVFSDLFWDNNANRSSGNMESIWVIQGAYNVPGGNMGASLSRTWGPYYANLIAPNGTQGMVLADSLGGRPVGYVRTTNYFNYDIWKGDWEDMRNSPWNIRRIWYYNNPDNPLYGQKVDRSAPGLHDTIQNMYPMVRKVEGVVTSINSSTTPYQKFIVYRLAEAYLLRAEAFMDLEKLQKAANDINMVRGRAHAPLINANQVDINFILDERARELIVEEPRRITLNRLGLWYKRTKEYSLDEPTFYYQIKQTIKPYMALFPIPQTAIDNSPGIIQNPGY